MKKLITILVLCICFSDILAQPFPVNPAGQGNGQTLSTDRGGRRALKGFVNGIYQDTTVANNDTSYISAYPGAQIWTTADQSLWLRNNTADGWLQLQGFIYFRDNYFLVTNDTVDLINVLDTLRRVGLDVEGRKNGLWLYQFTLPDSTPTVTGSWLTTGNAGINDAANFWGTTDDADPVVRRFNIEAGRFGVDQRLSLGEGATAGNEQSLALGFNANAQGKYSTAIGPGAIANNDSIVVIGDSTIKGVAIGKSYADYTFDMVGTAKFDLAGSANATWVLTNMGNGVTEWQPGGGGGGGGGLPDSVFFWPYFPKVITYGNVIGTRNNLNFNHYQSNALRGQYDSLGTFNVFATSLSQAVQLGSELTTTGSGTNWSGSAFSTGYTHTIGSTANLTTSTAAVSGAYYVANFTISGSTAGTINITYGGYSTGPIGATGTTSILASTTANLFVTPTSDFDGTLILSIMRVVAPATPSFAIKNSTGTLKNAMYGTGHDSTNVFIGKNSGSSTYANSFNSIGSNNVSIGTNAMQNNVTASQNVAIGVNALANDFNGNGFTAVGYNSLRNNSTGLYNTAVGYSTLMSVTTGLFNTAVGYNAATSAVSANSNSAFGYLNQVSTTGSNNSSFGAASMATNTTGSSNSVFGGFAFSGGNGNSNNVFGAGAMYQSSGSNNIAMGVDAGMGTAQPSSNLLRNTLIGENAMTNGYLGFNNVAVGYQAQRSSSNGYGNTAIGNFALNKNGISSVVLGAITGGSGYVDGTYTNVGLGFSPYGAVYPTAATVTVSGGAVTSVVITTMGAGIANGNTSATASNTELGGTGSGFSVAVSSVVQGGNYNIAIGDSAMFNTRRGNNNIVIGNYVDLPNDTSISRMLNIGNVLYGTNMYNGTTASSTPVAGGAIGIGTLTPDSTLSVVGGIRQSNNYYSAASTLKMLVIDTVTGGYAHQVIPTGGGSGVTTLAAIGSSPNANGATISGTTLNLQPASGSFGGVVTTGTQKFAGDKVFTGSIGLDSTNPTTAKLLVRGAPTSGGVDQQGVVVSGLYSESGVDHHPFRVSSSHLLSSTRSVALIDVSGKTVGTNNLGHMAGVQIAPFHTSSGTISNIYNLSSLFTNNGGTVTNYYDLRLNDAIGSGAITNNYGLYISAKTKGSTINRAIYTAGTTLSYIGGTTYFANKLAINSADGATLVEPLTINNNASGDAGLRIAQAGLNNWDIYTPTGQSYLGIRDVNAVLYFSILTGGNVGVNQTTQTSKFSVNGNVAFQRRTVIASSASLNQELVLYCDASSNTQAITAPTPVGIDSRIYIIEKTDNSANAVTITPAAGNIGGQSNYVLYNQGESVTIQSDNTNYQILTKVQGGIVTSSAGTLTLRYRADYIFTGTTTTWTLPAVSSSTTGRYNAITIKNRGSGAITLNTAAAGNDLYTTSAVNTLTINAGESYQLLPDGTFFNVQFN